MLWLSEVLIQNPEMKNFDELKVELKKRAVAGEVFFSDGCKATVS